MKKLIKQKNKGLSRHVRIYGVFFRQYLKGLLIHRVDFLVGAVAFIVSQSLGLLFLYIIFQNINQLAGFSANEVLLIYGISQIPKGIDHLFFDNIWLLPQRVRNGEMDRYLLRPINPLYAFLIERFQPDAFGEIILGISITVYSLTQVTVAVTIFKILGLVTFIVIGSFIFTAIKLATASTSFWIKNCYPLMQITYDLNDYTKYPKIIYPKAIQFIITYIIPLALLSYYPTLFLLDRISFLGVLAYLVPVTSGLLIIALFIWHKGLKRYESAGS
jgi:ABC-2 type transport system permease protein